MPVHTKPDNVPVLACCQFILWRNKPQKNKICLPAPAASQQLIRTDQHRLTEIFFPSGLGWHLPDLSQIPTWTPPPSTTCWTFPAFFAFYIFFYCRFFHFFRLFFSFFVAPSLFIRKANRLQQVIRIFPVRLTRSPVTGRRPDYTIFSVDIGVTEVTKNSRLFAVTSTTCSTLLKQLLRTQLLCFFHPSTSSKH